MDKQSRYLTYTMVKQISVEVAAPSYEDALEIFDNMELSMTLDEQPYDFEIIGSDLITEY